ncbi:hypothetical protein BI347_21670 [Chromobacterium sphagni]|uniref:Uncharacterized protein n=1 Tax=Chromobacterium sphagni TaxID=1903179 RepID=A0A1S1WT00_9NEIS|nr:hypothetical protein BI347_21670 [Chromobacterium sphagni]OHX17239.1 hypothetical protein BI344_21030 [Chromobacterium sphagni]
MALASSLRGIDILLLILWTYALGGEMRTAYEWYLRARSIGVGVILACTLQWMRGALGCWWPGWARPGQNKESRR